MDDSGSISFNTAAANAIHGAVFLRVGSHRIQFSLMNGNCTFTKSK